jgi:hypothetical protein
MVTSAYNGNNLPSKKRSEGSRVFILHHVVEFVVVAICNRLEVEEEVEVKEYVVGCDSVRIL